MKTDVVIIGAGPAGLFAVILSGGSVEDLNVAGSVAAAGALVFFLSDLIIGMGALCQVNQFDSLIWWLYPIGQLLLILCA